MIGFSVAERVAKSAKLSGVKGSLKQRAKLAASLNARFYGMVCDAFEQRGEVTKEEVGKFLRELCPGVRLKITKNANKNNFGSLVQIKDSAKGKIKEFIFRLPLSKSKSKKLILQNFGNLFHEARHLFDNITNPRSMAWNNIYQPLDIYENCYTNVLYNNELGLHQRVEMATNPSAAIHKRKAAIKKAILETLDEYKPTSKEKIEILEEWRNRLETEINAHTDGITYKHKFDEGHPEQTQKQSRFEKKQTTEDAINSNNNTQYFFRGKIEVIEELLAEELTKARNDHRTKLIEQGKIKNPEAHPEHQAESIARWAKKLQESATTT